MEVSAESECGVRIQRDESRTSVPVLSTQYQVHRRISLTASHAPTLHSITSPLPTPHSALRTPHFLLTVTDTGPGIPPDIRPHIFDPFFSGREAGRGLGLGLSKAWRIINLHGGQIDVESPANQGTTFHHRAARSRPSLFRPGKAPTVVAGLATPQRPGGRHL